MHGMPTPSAPVAPAARCAALAFRGLDDWIEVFTTGRKTDAQGNTANFERSDLAQMAANVAGAGVPWVVGHPETEHRAFAWSPPDDVRLIGDSLQVRGRNINTQFRALVDEGAYRERSLRIYRHPERGWTIAHIGWLGAVPPALDLAPLSYAMEMPAGCEPMEFAAEAPAWDTGYALREIGGLFRSLRDWLIAEKGLETADRLLPDWSITTVLDTARRISETPSDDTPAAEPESAAGMYSKGLTPMSSTKTYTEADMQAARTAAAAEAATATKLEFAAQAAELATLRSARQLDGFAAEVRGLQAVGKVFPAEAPGMAEFMAAIESGQATEFSFSAAAGTEAKQSPLAWFRAYLAKRPAVRLGASLAGPAGDAAQVDASDYRALANAASEYVRSEAAAGRTVTAAQAVAHVSAQATAGAA